MRMPTNSSKLRSEQAAGLSPGRLREAIRAGRYRGTTEGLAPGYLQANLLAIPAAMAYDFLLFSQRNPAACPVVEVTDAGDPRITDIARADVSTDLPRYRVFRNGECVREPESAVDWWREDLVAFLLGCSFTFEHALRRARLPLRHREAGRSIPIYHTGIKCNRAGVFSGQMVVTMRAFPGSAVAEAVRIMSRFPRAHGACVHVGDPAQIGISDLQDVSFGDPPVIKTGDVPVFTPCGVTSQLVAQSAEPDLMISHYPAHMLVADVTDEQSAGC